MRKLFTLLLSAVMPAALYAARGDGDGTTTPPVTALTVTLPLAEGWTAGAGITTLTVNGTLTAADVTKLSGATGVTTWLMQGCDDEQKLAAQIFTAVTGATNVVLPASWADGYLNATTLPECASLHSLLAATPKPAAAYTETDSETQEQVTHDAVKPTHLSAYIKTPGTLWTETASYEHFPELWGNPDDGNEKGRILTPSITATGTLGLADIRPSQNGQIDQNNMIAKGLTHLDLSQAVMESSIDETQDKVFVVDPALVSAKLPEGLTHIVGSELDGNMDLEEIEIPATVTSIGQRAFGKCQKLHTVTFRPGTAALTIGENAFDGIKTLTEIDLPAQLSVLGQEAFNNCEDLATVTFAEGCALTEIKSKTFYKTAIESIEIPAAVTTIGQEAFSDCGSLTDVTYAEGSRLTSIGNMAFNNNVLTHIDLPDGLTTIGNQAFSAKTSNTPLDIVIFPESITSIGSMAFANQWIKDVYFLGITCPTVGTQAFTEGTLDGNGHMWKEHIRVLNSQGNYETKDDATWPYKKPEEFTQGDRNYSEFNSGGESKALANAVTSGDKFVASHDLYAFGNGSQNYTSVLHLSPTLLDGQHDTELAKFTDPSRHYSLIDAQVGESQRWPTEQEMKNAFNIAGEGKNQDGTTFTVGSDEMSLHKFALVSFDAPSKTQTEDWDFTGLKGGLWWTLCVPFSMKKSEIKAVFGETTQVCEFNGVTRTHDTETGQWQLQLRFTHEICQWNRDGRTGTKEPVDDDATVIHAFMPYMIHPSDTDDGPEATLRRKYKNPKIQTGQPIPTRVTAEGTGIKYFFIGNTQPEESYMDGATVRYRKRRMPQYCYYLSKSTNADGTERHDLKFNQAPNRTFKQYIAVVTQDQPSQGVEDNTVFFTASGAGAKGRYGFAWGADAQTTAVESATMRTTVTCGEQTVFTLAGQRLATLPGKPGIYIVNGRKTVVR